MASNTIIGAAILRQQQHNAIEQWTESNMLFVESRGSLNCQPSSPQEIWNWKYGNMDSEHKQQLQEVTSGKTR